MRTFLRINPQKLSLSLPPNLRHYSTALNLASALLHGMNLSVSHGSAPAPSVAIDMNDLYEEAFYKISKRVRPSIQKAPVWGLVLSQAPPPAGGQNASPTA
jgi:5-methylcytosine-specific restriction endonuclease McrBC regulatory subunit McrC